MHTRLHSLLVAVALSLSTGCLQPAARDGAPEFGSDGTVWTLDLVRTLPGQQAEYLRSIRANWAGARHLARERGVVLGYRALAAAPDDERGWDVLLMTEYADRSSWEQREAVFQEIFVSPEFTAGATSRPSAELREFLAAGVVLESVVSVSRR